MLYITWGLIQDLKIKKEIPVEIRITSRIPKLRQEEIPINKFCQTIIQDPKGRKEEIPKPKK